MNIVTDVILPLALDFIMFVLGFVQGPFQFQIASGLSFTGAIMLHSFHTEKYDVVFCSMLHVV